MRALGRAEEVAIARAASRIALMVSLEAEVRPGRTRRAMNWYAWGVVLVTTTFITLTCWWLTRDRSIPVYDAGLHLRRAITFHDWLIAGRISRPFSFPSQYPPLGYLVGAGSALIGGVNVASPIVGENFVFVPLLTLGCYQTGRRLFGAHAGLLAAVFVLGSPLLIAQFHVFMLDAPATALVAVSIWLILASEDFGRTRVAALAGLAVGCGLLTKAPFPFFVAGIVLVALARGGWRHWQGLLAFAFTAFVVGAPWYLAHLSEVPTIVHVAGGDQVATSHRPPTLSLTNLSYYLRSTLNSALLAPLFILVLVGAAWMIVATTRGRIPKGPALELLIGALVAWFAITATPSHDVRYEMPLLPYLAVIGTGWIVYASRVLRIAAIAVLALAVVANTAGATFGAASPVRTTLDRAPVLADAFPRRIMWYSNAGYLVSGPQRDGDVLGVLRAMRRDGVRLVTFRNLAPGQAGLFRPRSSIAGRARTTSSKSRALKPPHQRGGPKNFSTSGLKALALIARLQTSPKTALATRRPRVVALIRGHVSTHAPRPCTTLTDGTGVWILRRDTSVGTLSFYCPYPQPHYYR